MKYLFIFFLGFIAVPLSATFNLKVKNPSQTQSASEQENVGYNSQGTFSPPSGARLDLIDEMSKSEQKATGFFRLNENQKKALSKWVEEYCRAAQVREERVIEKAAPNAVVAILGDGHYLKMGDGSVWNVSPNGWIYTYYWKAGEVVDITPGPDNLFPYTLTNQNYPLTVNAKRAAKNITRSFKNSYTITDITVDGKIVSLNNGSSWEVPSAARYMVAGWSKGNTVFITKVSKASGEHYEIFNGVTARSTYVKMLSRGKSMEKTSVKKRRISNNAWQKKLDEANASEDTSQTDSSDDTNRSEELRKEEQAASTN